MPSVYLKPGKEKPVLHRHPWIFAPAILRTDGKIEAGTIVDVFDANGIFLAKGYYNHRSQIRVRLLEWDNDKIIDLDWWKDKVLQALSLRNSIFNQEHQNAVRLIFAESDMIPGLIVDRFGDYAVLQALTAGIDRVKKEIAVIIKDYLSLKGVYERSDADVRGLEGLNSSNSLLAGIIPEKGITVIENQIQYSVDLFEGQKTGFFIDQRENRKFTAMYAAGKDVLDCFCYSGGFSLNALKNGAASVVSADSSASALLLYKNNLKLNGFKVSDENIIEADVFELLRIYRDTGRTFDLVILDPPKLAPAKAHLEKALRAYKDINLLAMKILRKNGILATFSCSGGVSTEEFRKAVGWAAKDSGREVQIIRSLSHPEDHPIRISYPESEYLKGLICRVL